MPRIVIIKLLKQNSQADSTSDIGSRLQQFEFRPDPCDGCERRTDDRPKRTERDKARRGTVKNSDPKLTTPGISDRVIIPGMGWVFGMGLVGSLPILRQHTCQHALNLTLTLTVFQACALPTPNHARVTFLNVTVAELCDPRFGVWDTERNWHL